MSCCDTPGLMPVAEALEAMLQRAQPVQELETLGLSEALGRVLAEDVFSSINVPPLDNSAMDGYALRLADLEAGLTLPIGLRVPAGAPLLDLPEGCAARIFTGAPVPRGADAVVMQEQCEASSEEANSEAVTLPEQIKLGQNIRPLGQDIRSGEQVLQAGQRLRAQELGILASVGVAEVKVYRRLKVAILSTGDELQEPGAELGSGQIYNSNRYTIAGLVEQLNMQVVDLGIVADNAEETSQALSNAAQSADVVISSGGVSVGEEDYVKACVEQMGHLHLWKLAIKPGKPLAFGEVEATPFIGLPGNPTSVFVTFNIVARAFLLKMQGLQDVQPLAYKLPASFTVSKAAPRQEYLRVRRVLKDGILSLERFDNQSSGVLTSASWATGLAVVQPNCRVSEGDLVDYLPFSEL